MCLWNYSGRIPAMSEMVLLCLSLSMIVLSRIICDMKIGISLIEDNMPDRYVTGASFWSILQYPLIDIRVKKQFS